MGQDRTSAKSNRGSARRAPGRGWLLAAALATAGPLHAQADLVVDINTSGSTALGFESFGSNSAVLDDRFYVFSAADPVTGLEPWVLDLASGVAQRLADINSGPAGSAPLNFTVVGTSLLFTATDAMHGTELWVTDGTPGGTELVEDIYPGVTSSAIAELTPVPGARAVFRADDGISGPELWISDGTPAGTYQVADIQSGPTGSGPASFAWAGGTLFFRANDGAHGSELWKWSSGATSLVADIEPGPASSSPGHIYPVPGYVVFGACRSPEGCELWRSDGTAAGTLLLDDLNPTGNSSPSRFFWHAGLATLFFNADDGVHGDELFQRTLAGATRLTDLYSNGGDSNPVVLGTLPGQLLFVARDDAPGTRLFAYDGFSVSVVKSLASVGAPGVAGSSVGWNGRVYFQQNASCWSTDGTAFGTIAWGLCVNVPDLALGAARIVHARRLGGESEIWSIDAADALEQETDFASFSSNPAGFAWLGTTAFFGAEDGVFGRELWFTGGTPASTGSLDLEPGGSGSNPRAFTPFGGAIWFIADSFALGDEIWHTDGTAGGTAAYELAAGPDGSAPSELAVLGSHLFAAAYDPALGAQLFRISDAGSPPELLAYGGDPDLYPERLTPSGTRLFFFGENAATGRELFVVDETATQSAPLEVIPGPGAPDPLDELAAWNGAAWFVADDGVHGPQIWTSTGTTVTRVTTLSSGNAPSNLAAGPGGLYFAYDDGTFGKELWRTDGSATTRVSDIAPLGGSSSPSNLTLAGDRLYFRANDGATGEELWWSDGVTVAQVADLRPGPSGSRPSGFRAAGDRLIVAADDGGGEELWIASGAGARRLPEAWVGAGGSNPTEVAVDPTGAFAYFSGIRLTTWREPFRVDLPLFWGDFESGDTAAWTSTVP